MSTRAGLVRVATPILESLLAVPAGHTIAGADFDISSGSVRFLILGPDMPSEYGGAVIYELTPTFEAKTVVAATWPTRGEG